MTTGMSTDEAREELRVAERALAAFDSSSLTTEDGQMNVAAEHELGVLQARVATARSQVEALLGA